MISAKRIFLGSAKAAPQPTYDAEVEYIASTGTQWIDTGVHGANGMIVECRFKPEPIASEASVDSFPFLARRGARRMGAVVQVASTFAVGCLTPLRSFAISNAFYGAWHTVRLDSEAAAQSAMLDGEPVGSWTNSAWDPTVQPIPLFASRNTAFVPVGIGNGAIATFSITDKATGRKVIDLTAVRIGTEGAMHDRVSGKIFRNAGTGDFSYGPDRGAV